MADWAVCARCNKDIEKSGAIQEGESYFCNSVCAAAHKMSKRQVKQAWKPAEYSNDQNAGADNQNMGGAYIFLSTCILIIGLFAYNTIKGDHSGYSQSAPQENTDTDTGLYIATDSEWVKASHSERLTVATDFAAALKSQLGFTDEAGMYASGAGMKACIDEAAKAEVGHRVKEIAALCGVLMAKQK